jgi:hypothetical protein
MEYLAAVQVSIYNFLFGGRRFSANPFDTSMEAAKYA